VIGMSEPGAKTVRRKKLSTISVAMDMVKDASADAFVSAGTTGAAVAAADPPSPPHVSPRTVPTARTGAPASTLVRQFETVPQMLKNVRFAAGKTPLETGSVQAAITANETRMAGKGRILIRKSGTEPLIRVMAECEDATLLAEVVGDIGAAVEAAV
jgi:hypothetical protein